MKEMKVENNFEEVFFYSTETCFTFWKNFKCNWRKLSIKDVYAA